MEDRVVVVSKYSDEGNGDVCWYSSDAVSQKQRNLAIKGILIKEKLFDISYYEGKIEQI